MPEKSETEHIVGGDYDDPPKIAVKADEGTHFLYLAFSRGENANLAVRTDLDKLVNGLVGPPDLSPFDVVLLAQGNGKVIFQKSLSGIEVARIKNLPDVSGADDKKVAKQIDAESLTQVSQLGEVKIAGARYRLYSQPVQIAFLPADPDKKSARNSQRSSPKGQSGVKSANEASDTKGANPTLAAKSSEDTAGLWVLCGSNT